jgi:hypothetical protein
MRRAIDTMIWLFRWLSWEDEHRIEHEHNPAFFGAMRGSLLIPFDYTDQGIVVRRPELSSEEVSLVDDLLQSQYLASISETAENLDLFARMTFNRIGITCEDAEPETEGDPILRERYHIRHNGRKALVFCQRFDGLIDAATIGGIALRAMAHAHLKEPGWSALCILHHQRHIPVELREVELAIPEPIARMAADSGITLMTAPDLRFIVRGTMQYGWDTDRIRDLLFNSGRQGLVPPEYRRVGSVVRFFAHHSAVSVQLDAGETIKVGDTIGIRLQDRYHEERVESLEVNREKEPSATGPVRAAIQIKLAKSDLKTNQAVYVRHPDHGASTS